MGHYETELTAELRGVAEHWKGVCVGGVYVGGGGGGAKY